MVGYRSNKYENRLKGWLTGLFNVGLPGEIIYETLVFSNKQFKKILLLRHDRIGDLLISVPFIKALKGILPQSEIDILLSFKNYSAKSAVVDLVSGIYLLSNNVPKSLWLLRKLRKQKYDLIIDLIDNESLNSNIIMNIVNPRIRLGFDKSNRFNYDYVIPKPDKTRQHPVDRLTPFLRLFGNHTYQQVELSFHLTKLEIQNAKMLLNEENSKFKLAVNLSGSGPEKYWGNSNFATLIDSIKKQYPEIVIYLFATEKFREAAKIISEKTNSKIAPIQNDFNIYAAMLNECDMIITPDTAAVHLASAFRKPVIALYVHSDPNGDCPWTPVAVPNRVLIAKNNLNELAPELVLEKFNELAAEIGL